MMMTHMTCQRSLITPVHRSRLAFILLITLTGLLSYSRIAAADFTLSALQASYNPTQWTPLGEGVFHCPNCDTSGYSASLTFEDVPLDAGWWRIGVEARHPTISEYAPYCGAPGGCKEPNYWPDHCANFSFSVTVAGVTDGARTFMVPICVDAQKSEFGAYHTGFGDALYIPTSGTYRVTLSTPSYCVIHWGFAHVPQVQSVFFQYIAPRSPDGNPCQMAGPGGQPGRGCGGPLPQGAPDWTVNMATLNLYLHDVPLWYDAPIGPSPLVHLSFNSHAPAAAVEPFGVQWVWNYGAYLDIAGDGAVTVVMPDGRRDVYVPDGSGGFVRPYQVFNTLTHLAANSFELRFPDDTVYAYQMPAGTSLIRPVLTAIRDAYGQTLTFTHNAAGQLTTITDALNQATNLTYDAQGRVTQVTDPFSRSAAFTYDAAGHLTGLTDMGNYTTTLTYDTHDNPATLTNPRGTWGFAVEPPDNQPGADAYPAPGGVMGRNARLTVTNPLGGREEYFYSDATNRSWYVSPADYVAYVSPQTNNAAAGVPKTRYAFTLLGTAAWYAINSITTPEGVTVTYGYDAAGNRTSVQIGSNPAAAYAYNALGRVTSVTDPLQRHPTTLSYAANQVDVTAITNGLGTISLTYNGQHDVTAITDRLGHLTEFGYNSVGQMIWQKDWLDGRAIQTAYTYDPTTHRLSTVQRAGQTVAQYTHDAIGRVRTATDATGLTLTYSYNPLNAVTTVLYPDGKTAEAVYSDCCPRLVDRTKDRAGRWTQYAYDALKRLTDVVNPEGGLTHYAYDANSNLRFLTDPENHVTEFTYDLDNRRRTKIYADGSYEEWVYNALNQVDYAYNARRIQKDYSYDPNGNLTGVHYSDSTPDITFTYDAYDRLDTMPDGLGTWIYGYNANSDLTSVDGPWVDDTLAYTLDALGRITAVNPQGGSPRIYGYDDLNRLLQVQTAAGTFTYGYAGANPLAQSLTRPNGSVTTYQYDGLHRLLALVNKTSSGAVLSQHTYTYNAQDFRDSETVTGSAIPPIPIATDTSTNYTTNALNQLTGTTGPTRTFTYDADGNLTNGYTKDGYPFVATYDAENRMTALTYTGAGNVVFTTEYAYSGDGLLAIERKYENTVLTQETRLIRDGGLVVQERNASNVVTRGAVWGLSLGGGIGGLLNLAQAGQYYSYLYDGSGNVEAVLNASQAVVAAYRYDPFGNLTAKTGPLNQPYGFSTKRYDSNVGMVLYEARPYIPGIGRWASRDPLGEAGGLNLYAFVGNNPVNWVDPWGFSVGHHYVPKCIFTRAGLPQEVLNIFNKATTGTIPGGHGWSKAHADYVAAVRNLWQQYITNNNIDPAKMTVAQAQQFINMVKNSQIPCIKDFLQGIQTLQGPVFFIMPNPCLFLPELGPNVCPGVYPTPDDYVS